MPAILARSSSVSSRCMRSTIVPSLRASMKSISPRRSRKRAVLLVAREEPQADRDLRRVEELAWQRHHAIHQSASMMALRISPSPDWLDDIEPLANTKPRSPVGARW